MRPVQEGWAHGQFGHIATRSVELGRAVLRLPCAITTRGLIGPLHSTPDGESRTSKSWEAGARLTAGRPGPEPAAGAVLAAIVYAGLRHPAVLITTRKAEQALPGEQIDRIA